MESPNVFSIMDDADTFTEYQKFNFDDFNSSFNFDDFNSSFNFDLDASKPVVENDCEAEELLNHHMLNNISKSASYNAIINDVALNDYSKYKLGFGINSSNDRYCGDEDLLGLNTCDPNQCIQYNYQSDFNITAPSASAINTAENCSSLNQIVENNIELSPSMSSKPSENSPEMFELGCQSNQINSSVEDCTSNMEYQINEVDLISTGIPAHSFTENVNELPVLPKIVISKSTNGIGLNNILSNDSHIIHVNENRSPTFSDDTKLKKSYNNQLEHDMSSTVENQSSITNCTNSRRTVRRQKPILSRFTKVDVSMKRKTASTKRLRSAPSKLVNCSDTKEAIKQQRKTRRCKAYQLEPFEDPKLERCRRNAINAKKNRDYKNQRLNQLEAEVAQIRKEKEELSEKCKLLEVQNVKDKKDLNENCRILMSQNKFLLKEIAMLNLKIEGM